MKVGSRVELKSLANINEIVAIGNVKALIGVIFNGRDLGPGICEVVVQTRVKDEEMLIYPCEHIETIGESIGALVAWPLSMVFFCIYFFFLIAFHKRAYISYDGLWLFLV